MTLFEIILLVFLGFLALIWIISDVFTFYALSREEPRILDVLSVAVMLVGGPFLLAFSMRVYRLYLQSKKETKKEDL
jgi:amino acid transporter